MAGAGSYRFTGSITVGSSSTQVAGEFQAPDRVHELITTAIGQTIEVVFAGGKTYVHDQTSGRWSVGPSASLAGPSAGSSAGGDPRGAFLVLQEATDVTASTDGGGVQFSLLPDAAARIATLPHQAGSVAVRGRAVLSGAELSSLSFSVRAGNEQLAVMLGYSDVGHGPAVTVPTA
jgi:hypothetical protein